MFCYGLDGDNMRGGLCSDLGFSSTDRDENIRRVTEVSKLFADSGSVSICSFISPFTDHRVFPRQVHETANLPFFEVFIDTPLEECEKRDTKGNYKLARAGKIKGFTGIDQPYDRPSNPELVIKTVDRTVEQCVQDVLNVLVSNNIVSANIAYDYGAWYATNQAKGNNRENLGRVHELFISAGRKAAAVSEAKSLPSVNISTIDLQWIQARRKFFFWEMIRQIILTRSILGSRRRLGCATARFHARERVSPGLALSLPAGWLGHKPLVAHRPAGQRRGQVSARGIFVHHSQSRR